MSVEDLIEEIEIEFELIDKIRDELDKLNEKPVDFVPTLFELTAAAGFLHNFYNGIENIFKRIMKYYKIREEKSDNWHKELLKRFYDKESSLAFLDDSVYDNLLELLKFRHVFIHSYSFFLQWELLKPLIRKVLDSYPKFKDLLYKKFSS